MVRSRIIEHLIDSFKTDAVMFSTINYFTTKLFYVHFIALSFHKSYFKESFLLNIHQIIGLMYKIMLEIFKHVDDTMSDKTHIAK